MTCWTRFFHGTRKEPFLMERGLWSVHWRCWCLMLCQVQAPAVQAWSVYVVADSLNVVKAVGRPFHGAPQRVSLEMHIDGDLVGYASDPRDASESCGRAGSSPMLLIRRVIARPMLVISQSAVCGCRLSPGGSGRCWFPVVAEFHWYMMVAGGVVVNAGGGGGTAPDPTNCSHRARAKIRGDVRVTVSDAAMVGSRDFGVLYFGCGRFVQKLLC